MAAAVIDLGNELTITDVESRKIEFSNIISDGLPVTFDAEGLDQVDGAGMQLLAVFFKEAASKKLNVSWKEVSTTFYDAAKMMGLIDALMMKDVEPKDDGEGTSWGLF